MSSLELRSKCARKASNEAEKEENGKMKKETVGATKTKQPETQSRKQQLAEAPQHVPEFVAP